MLKHGARGGCRWSTPRPGRGRFAAYQRSNRPVSFRRIATNIFPAFRRQEHEQKLALL